MQCSDSESEEKITSEEETESGTGDEKIRDRNQGKLSEYEMQRLKRIEENRVRMEAMGLRTMASTLMASAKKNLKKESEIKGKKKMVDEDEEYIPTQEEDGVSSEEEEDKCDEDFALSHKKHKKNPSTRKNQGPTQKPGAPSDFVEDDEALMQAIALSLQDNAGFLDIKSAPSKSSNDCLRDNETSKDRAHMTTNDRRNKNKDDGKRKKKKPVGSRVQMSEDEVLVHFFQFDETGKESLTVQDLHRMALAHDFTWSEKELADMITCFDSDGDGKINLDDFRKIVGRCNMIKGPDASKLRDN